MAGEQQKRALEHARDDIGARDNPGNAWVAAGEQPQSFMDRVKDHFIDRVVPEVWDALKHKMAQGAAELSQALNSQSNAYVPYGTGQQPLEVEGPTQSYQDRLREASERQGREEDRGISR